MVSVSNLVSTRGKANRGSVSKDYIKQATLGMLQQAARRATRSHLALHSAHSLTSAADIDVPIGPRYLSHYRVAKVSSEGRDDDAGCVSA